MRYDILVRRHVINFGQRTLGAFLMLELAVALVGCSGSNKPTSRKELEHEFEAEFGVAPSSKIVDLRCRTVVVGDSWSKWMRFTYDESTVGEIAGSGFAQASEEDLKRSWEAHWSQDVTSSTPNPNAPNWFRLPGDRAVRIYYKVGHPKDYAGYSYLWIDDSNKTVYARSSAWH